MCRAPVREHSDVPCLEADADTVAGIEQAPAKGHDVERSPAASLRLMPGCPLRTEAANRLQLGTYAQHRRQLPEDVRVIGHGFLPSVPGPPASGSLIRRANRLRCWDNGKAARSAYGLA